MPAAAPDARISISMAMDSLAEAAEDVRLTRAKYEQALATRDDLIRDMRKERIPYKRIAEVVHLSRDSIDRIIKSGRKVSPTAPQA